MKVKILPLLRHRVGFRHYGDANAQAVCSCGWEGAWRSSGDEYYRWEARWNMAKGDAFQHLQAVGVYVPDSEELGQ